MKRVILVATFALLTACTPNHPAAPPAPPLHVTTGISKSTGNTYIYSPMNVLMPSKALPMRVMWQLNTEIAKKNHHITHTLRISIAYAAAKHKRYVSVVDEKGTTYKFVMAGKSGKPCPGETCMQSDTLDVTLADADLRARAKTGWPFKLSTKANASIPATLPPDIITLQINETDKAAAAKSPQK